MTSATEHTCSDDQPNKPGIAHYMRSGGCSPGKAGRPLLPNFVKYLT